MTVRPFRGSPDDKEVLVRTEVRGGGDPVQLDYRLEKTPGEGGGWKIYNLNVLGVWLVDTYRTQFSQQINSKGIDGLIAALAARNKSNDARAERSTHAGPARRADPRRGAGLHAHAAAGPGGADAARSTVVDASALAQFDSSALAVLLECRREASALGPRLRGQGPAAAACANWRRSTALQAFCLPRPEAPRHAGP